MKKQRQGKVSARKAGWGWLLLLHAALFIYSLSGVFNKLASAQKVMSPKFILFFFCMLAVLGIYALVWQQVIRYIPLTTAYANKGITIVWGILFGLVLFNEKVTIRQLVGAAVVILGIILYVYADQDQKDVQLIKAETETADQTQERAGHSLKADKAGAEHADQSVEFSESNAEPVERAEKAMNADEKGAEK